MNREASLGLEIMAVTVRLVIILSNIPPIFNSYAPQLTHGTIHMEVSRLYPHVIVLLF